MTTANRPMGNPDPPSPVRSVEEELAHLPDLSLDQLKARWLELKGVPLPKFMRRGLMTRAVAYAIQEAAFGGLDPGTRKRLDVLAAQIVPNGTKPPLRPKRVKPGTRLVREWKGRTHDVMVLEDGFAWKGKRYASLSVIAREITGTRWNGWMFFGLKQREAAKRAAASTASASKRPGARRRPEAPAGSSNEAAAIPVLHRHSEPAGTRARPAEQPDG
jgi:hypothetical protein